MSKHKNKKKNKNTAGEKMRVTEVIADDIPETMFTDDDDDDEPIRVMADDEPAFIPDSVVTVDADTGAAKPQNETTGAGPAENERMEEADTMAEKWMNSNEDNTIEQQASELEAAAEEHLTAASEDVQTLAEAAEEEIAAGAEIS